jgi:hypothetical protein
MLIDTEEETNNKLIAISNGFRSGLASDMIFRSEDTLCGPLENVPGRTLDNIEDFSGGGGEDVGVVSSIGG